MRRRSHPTGALVSNRIRLSRTVAEDDFYLDRTRTRLYVALAVDPLDSFAIRVVPRRIHDARAVDLVAHFLACTNATIRRLGACHLDHQLLHGRCRRRCYGRCRFWRRSTRRYVVVKGFDRNPALIFVPNSTVQHRTQGNGDVRDVVSVVEARQYRTGYDRRTSNCLTGCVACNQVLLLDLPVVRNKSSKPVLDFCASYIKILTEISDLEVIPN